MAPRFSAPGIGLLLSVSTLLGWTVGVRAGAEPPQSVTSAVAAWSTSKAGVFVLALPSSEVPAGLGLLSTELAGVAVGVLTEGKAPAGVQAVSDPGGVLAARYALTPGNLVLLRADGTEIKRMAVPVGASSAQVADAIEASRRARVGEYNLPKRLNVALDGFDPVSYFDPSGRPPEKGSAPFASRYRGVTYRFVDADRRERFNADPERYLPTYGGWCATAMAEGDKVEVDPKNYKVTDGRLFLFYKGILGNAKKDWDKDEKGLESRADASWRSISGEAR